MKSLAPQLVVEFSVDEMHLTQIRLARVTRHARPVLNGAPEVRVAFHPETSQQSDALLVALAQRVLAGATNSSHNTPSVAVYASRDHVQNLAIPGRGGASRRTGGD